MKVLNSYIVLNIANRIQKTGIRSCFLKGGREFFILREIIKKKKGVFFFLNFQKI